MIKLSKGEQAAIKKLTKRLVVRVTRYLRRVASLDDLFERSSKTGLTFGEQDGDRTLRTDVCGTLAQKGLVTLHGVAFLTLEPLAIGYGLALLDADDWSPKTATAAKAAAAVTRDKEGQADPEPDAEQGNTLSDASQGERWSVTTEGLLSLLAEKDEEIAELRRGIQTERQNYEQLGREARHQLERAENRLQDTISTIVGSWAKGSQA